MIEKVKVLRTLKAGSNIWHVGEVVGPPVPDDLLGEIRKGWVQIVKETILSPVKKVPVEVKTTSTSRSSASSIKKTVPRRKRK